MNLLRKMAIVVALVAFVLLGSSLVPTVAGAQESVGTPETIGDQLFFFYDASGPRTAFLNVANPSDTPVDLEVSFHPTSGGRAELRFLLGAWANRVVNPSELDGVGGTAGLAVVTPVLGLADPRPVVPPAPLAGSFTQANTTGGAAMGGNALGRLAVGNAGTRASAGAIVDGSSVRYQRFAPEAIAIPTYFDPGDLDPPANDGNRVIVIAFEDSYGDRYSVGTPSGPLEWALFDAAGVGVAGAEISEVPLVFVTSLQDLAEGTTLDSSGKAYFRYDTGSTGNYFGIFLQSLAAFGAGERMPAVETFPTAVPARSN